jgi:glycosyltransferase involved in cell wall biosynthesis
MRVTWVVYFSYSSRNHHGAILRYVNFSREMMAQGHEVQLVYSADPGDESCAFEWFEDLRRNRVISGFESVTFQTPSKWHGRLGVLFPGFSNSLQRSSRMDLIGKVRTLVQKQQSDVVIFSDRRLFFLISELSRDLPCIIEFGDSLGLGHFRQTKYELQQPNIGKALQSAKRTMIELLFERHYSRFPNCNISISEADQSVIRMLSGRPQANYLVPNGIAGLGVVTGAQKVPNQMIFSGNMDFPPNYEAALWFIDHVFPLILREVPGARLLIAGANPVPELRARANANIEVTGFVKDLIELIASSSLFVAPMVTGSGFKNKVAEAIANGTYVVSTPMGVEFLSAEIRSLLAVASAPEEFASKAVSCLRDPIELQKRNQVLRAKILQELSWSASTGKLLSALQNAVQQSGY